jgi:hypothetical protein
VESKLSFAESEAQCGEEGASCGELELELA